jgi:hypothetical protein
MGDLERLSMCSRIRLGACRKMPYSLNVVTDFLGDELGDVLIEGVLDADLITVCAWPIISSSFSGREM